MLIQDKNLFFVRFRYYLKQLKLKSELEKEYGAVNINLEDGTYTEIKEDVEDNKKDQYRL